MKKSTKVSGQEAKPVAAETGGDYSVLRSDTRAPLTGEYTASGKLSGIQASHGVTISGAESKAERTVPSERFRPQLAPAGLRTFFRIAAKWALTSDQQQRLLGLPRSTFFKAKAAPDRVLVGSGTLERISYILGVYKALHILLPNNAAADAWISRPNAASPFNGQPALKRMLAGNVSDLYVVRQYLDAQRGW